MALWLANQKLHLSLCDPLRMVRWHLQAFLDCSCLAAGAGLCFWLKLDAEKLNSGFLDKYILLLFGLVLLVCCLCFELCCGCWPDLLHLVTGRCCKKSSL